MRDQTWDLLQAALDSITYKDDSRFGLHRDDAANYAVLYVYVHAPNTYTDPPREDRFTRHEFIVPVATYDQANWTRWVFERVKTIEIHETCEWFKVDGERIYAPHHGNGEDPYMEWHLGTLEQVSKAPGDD